MNVTVYIGEMGSGKSHRGDDMAGPEMATAIKKFKIISNEMIDDLICRLAERILQEQRKGSREVVVAQALYRREHRAKLARIIEVNNLNSAGFYRGDMNRLVAALEAPQVFLTGWV